MKILLPPTQAHRRRTTEAVRGRTLGFLAAVATVFGTLVGLERPTLALQGGEDASTLPVLIDKRYGVQNHIDVHVQFSTPLVAKFVESTGVMLGADYGIRDWGSLGLVGGFWGGGETDVVDQVRQTRGAAPLSDLHRMVWAAGVDATFIPFYGRVSFASEYNPGFDLYLFAGGGVLGTERELGSPADGGARPDPETNVGPYGNFGVGLHFHVFDFMALRLEYRQFLFEDPEIPPEELQATTGDPDDAGGGVGTAQQFQIGLQFEVF